MNKMHPEFCRGLAVAYELCREMIMGKLPIYAGLDSSTIEEIRLSCFQMGKSAENWKRKAQTLQQEQDE